MKQEKKSWPPPIIQERGVRGFDPDWDKDPGVRPPPTPTPPAPAPKWRVLTQENRG